MTDTITVHVPFRLVKRGGRKEMVLPIGRPVLRNVDDTLGGFKFQVQRLI